MPEMTVKLEAKLPTDFTIAYWYSKPQVMPESEQQHVIEMLEQGYVEGELNNLDENRGWWRIISQSKAR